VTGFKPEILIEESLNESESSAKDEVGVTVIVESHAAATITPCPKLTVLAPPPLIAIVAAKVVPTTGTATRAAMPSMTLRVLFFLFLGFATSSSG
jgi:hypothetical protein